MFVAAHSLLTTPVNPVADESNNIFGFQNTANEQEGPHDEKPKFKAISYKIMPSKKHKPEEIIGKLREVEIVLAQGASTAEACRRIAVSEQTYYRWRKEYGGLKTDQARRMKDLEKENQRLRRAISDLTLDKLILQEAARGNF